jgi:carboxymethylenebutenolidase
MSGRQLKISASDGGEFDAYLALPTEPSAPGIVMLHEIFGVTDWVRESADLFAEHGYCVAAPDMFWRMTPNFDGDHRDPEQTEQGRRYKQLIDHDTAMDDIAAVVSRLKSMPECNGKIGVTGFCTGGTLTYLAAARLPIDAAVAYYGTQIHEFLDEGGTIACPTMFHMGDTDDRVPQGLPDMTRKALIGVPDIAIHTYDAGHAFANTHRPDYYSEVASQTAYARTFELFDGLKSRTD